MSDILTSKENYIYLGLVEPVHYFLHVYYVERDAALNEAMTGDVYNCMIQEKMIGPGQKVIVFNLCLKDTLIWPVLANHISFPKLVGADKDAMCTVLKRLLDAERKEGENGLVIIAHFDKEGERPSKYTTHDFFAGSMIKTIWERCKVDANIASALQPLQQVVSVKRLS